MVSGTEAEFWEFPLTTTSIRGARERLRLLVDDKLAPDVIEVAALLVTELATNAVQHARTPFTVSVEMKRERLRVSVTDHSSQQPQLVTDRHLSGAPGGWGLQVVDRMASRWGVEIRPGGKSVWFEMDPENVNRRLA